MGRLAHLRPHCRIALIWLAACFVIGGAAVIPELGRTYGCYENRTDVPPGSCDRWLEYMETYAFR
jgi:hypothetical protein